MTHSGVVLVRCFSPSNGWYVVTGKVDLEVLEKTYQSQRKRLGSCPSPGDVGTLKQTVQFLWQVPKDKIR